MPMSRFTVGGRRTGAALTVVASGAVMALTAATGAGAQEPGVHIDPGSPTGKEYAVPLSQARGDAAPSHRRNGSASNPAGGGSSGGSSSGGSSSGGSSSGGSSFSDVPFGQGIGTTAAGRPRTPHSARRASGRSERSHGGASRSRALPAASDLDGGAGTGTPVILAIVVLAAGVLGGLSVRLLVRRRPAA
jgi:hypothetical protein